MSNDRELPLKIMEQVSGGFKLPGITVFRGCKIAAIRRRLTWPPTGGPLAWFRERLQW